MSKQIIENLNNANIKRTDIIKAGFSAQKYDDVLREKSSYKVEDIIRLSEKFQLSLDYLIFGNKKRINVANEEKSHLEAGENYSEFLCAKEKELLDCFRQLNNVGTEQMLIFARGLSNSLEYKKAIADYFGKEA